MGYSWVAAWFLFGATSAPARPETDESGLISQALAGWRTNRALIKSGSGTLFVDTEDNGKTGPCYLILFKFKGERRRWETYSMPYARERDRRGPLPDPTDLTPEMLYINAGKYSIRRWVDSRGLAILGSLAVVRSHALYETIDLGRVLGNKSVEILEQRQGQVHVTRETVAGEHLIRLDWVPPLEAKHKVKRSTWLAPSKGYAIVRRDVFGEGSTGRYDKLAARVKHQLVKLGNGAWFPVITHYELYKPDERGQPRPSYRGRWIFSGDFKFNVPVADAWFSLATVLKPGEHVRDRRFDPPRHYTYAPLLSWVDWRRDLRFLTLLALAVLFP